MSVFPDSVQLEPPYLPLPSVSATAGRGHCLRSSYSAKHVWVQFQQHPKARGRSVIFFFPFLLFLPSPTPLPPLFVADTYGFCSTLPLDCADNFLTAMAAAVVPMHRLLCLLVLDASASSSQWSQVLYEVTGVVRCWCWVEWSQRLCFRLTLSTVFGATALACCCVPWSSCTCCTVLPTPYITKVLVVRDHAHESLPAPFPGFLHFTKATLPCGRQICTLTPMIIRAQYSYDVRAQIRPAISNQTKHNVNGVAAVLDTWLEETVGSSEHDYTTIGPN